MSVHLKSGHQNMLSKTCDDDNSSHRSASSFEIKSEKTAQWKANGKTRIRIVNLRPHRQKKENNEQMRMELANKEKINHKPAIFLRSIM